MHVYMEVLGPIWCWRIWILLMLAQGFTADKLFCVSVYSTITRGGYCCDFGVAILVVVHLVGA
ncbi:hypothetical protein Peur_054968 [Populus x canadensis]